MSSDHAITHTHEHVHRVPHPDAWNRTTMSEPHTHEHEHTSIRQSFYTEGAPTHRMHFHIKENRPVALPYKHSTGVIRAHEDHS